MKERKDILEEILAHVKLSPAAAFDALKYADLLNGYKLVSLTLECPSCHAGYTAWCAHESWAGLSARTRLEHARNCGLAEQIRTERAAWIAKEKP